MILGKKKINKALLEIGTEVMSLELKIKDERLLGKKVRQVVRDKIDKLFIDKNIEY